MQRMWMLLCAVGLLTGFALAAEDKKEEAPKEATKDAAKDAPKDPASAEPKKSDVNEPVGPLKDLKDKVSYAIGLNMGRNLMRDRVEINVDFIAAGIKAAFTEKTDKPLLTEEQIREVIVAFQKELVERPKREGAEFLAANGKKEGVKATKSGLQYEVLVDGKGPSPKATDVVRTHYKGTLLDGTVFDSSYERNAPAKFEVGGVIQGWTEALQLMKVGSKWKLYLPSELAYGATGTRDGTIGPNQVLIFEVELLGIEPPAPATIPGLPAPKAP